MRSKIKVKKNSLMILAGVFWIIAGYNVFNISRKIQLNLTPEYNILSFMVFTVFYRIILKTFKIKKRKGSKKRLQKEHVPTNWTEKIKTVWGYIFYGKKKQIHIRRKSFYV